MKVMILVVMVFALFLAAHSAYALGGGGRHGDGRTDFLQGAGRAGPSATSTQGHGANQERALAAYLQGGPGTSVNVDPSTDPSGSFALLPASVPEPAAFLLLGSSLIGLAGLRRKFRK